MDKILEGIWNLYNADATLKAALTGKLWFEEAQGATMPYATYFLISGHPEYWFGGEYYELPTIQFDIFATTSATRVDCYNKLIAVFDDAKPTATGYTPVIMEREFYQFLRAGDQDQDFRAIVQYRLRMSKN
jgi:hypothetical protein